MNEKGDVGVRLRDRYARMRSEWIIDRLMDLVARGEMRRPDSPFYTDERFIASMATDLRAHADMAEDDDDPELDAIATHLYERLLRRGLGDGVAGARPTERHAEVTAPSASAIAEARRASCAPRYDLAVAAGTGRELWEEACVAWIELPPETPAGDYVALTVAGESMEPVIHSGDVVLVKLGRQLAIDSLVVARGPDDGYVIKRVGRVLGSRVELKSLNPQFEPLLIPRDPSRVLGTVVLRWCEHDPRVGDG